MFVNKEVKNKRKKKFCDKKKIEKGRRKKRKKEKKRKEKRKKKSNNNNFDKESYFFGCFTLLNSSLKRVQSLLSTRRKSLCKLELFTKSVKRVLQLKSCSKGI